MPVVVVVVEYVVVVDVDCSVVVVDYVTVVDVVYYVCPMDPLPEY